MSCYFGIQDTITKNARAYNVETPQQQTYKEQEKLFTKSEKTPVTI